MSKKIIATNRNAHRLYQIQDTYEAGIVLQGTEAKSIRQGFSQISDAYVYVKNGEAFLANLHIKPYEHGGHYNHDPLRTRKLLLHKKEIKKLKAAVEEKGKAIVALNLHYYRGRVKIELGTGQGKKLHDKRQDMKEKDEKRRIEQTLKQYRKG